MDKKICDICGEEIKGAPYAIIYEYSEKLRENLDICSTACLKTFVQNGFKPKPDPKGV